MRILAPFSGKFKYNQNHFPHEKYKSPRLCLANVNWHYNVSTDDEYEYCLRHYGELLEERFQLFSEENDCIVKNQPHWDLQKAINLDSNYAKSVVATKENCPNKGIELLV